jgi:hypothetical protein
MASLHTSAAQRLLAAFIAAHPGSITLAGRTISAAVIPKRGGIATADGGFRQTRSVRVMFAFTLLTEAALFDATTGVLLRQSLVFDGVSYRVDSAQPDPYKVYWTVSALEAVA